MSDYYLEEALNTIPTTRLDNGTKHQIYQLILEEDIESAYAFVQDILSDLVRLEAILEYSREEPQWEDYFNIDMRVF